MMHRRIVLALMTLFLLVACNSYRNLPSPAPQSDWKTRIIPAEPQTEGGDPEKGFDYLIYGDYIGSGVPYEMLAKRLERMDEMSDTVLQRTGPNEKVGYGATVFEAENGVLVTNGNCFSCHAGELNGEVILGLGNSFSDFRQSMVPMGKLMRLGMRLRYGKDSEEWVAYEDFGYYFKAMAPHIETNQPGVNPAAHLAEACTAYRDPQRLTYTEEPQYELPDYVVGTDVPPLWNVDKKNALYYTAVGRGDFTKLLFQASVLGIHDSTMARKAVTNFKDVVAWLEALEPPAYPGEVNDVLAERGRKVFEEHCSGCHGTYGDSVSYPNKVVALHVVKTDPLYAEYAVQAPIVEWYNKSWFATSHPKSRLEPEAGYVAPPLDGIWATAPYLHNGSVPNLATLLNSLKRPKYWQRSGESDDYNLEKIGWNYEEKKGSGGKWTYDTTIPGYSNAGHYFGDKLSEPDRQAVIEYLKTL